MSDALQEIQFNTPGAIDQAELRLCFVKYLVHAYPDTNVEVDIREEYKHFRGVQEAIVE